MKYPIESLNPATLNPRDLAKYIDHTILAPDATREQVRRLCEEALEYRFAGVCVNPTYVAYVTELLAGSGIAVCSVIGFPLGATTPQEKAFEAAEAVSKGAAELDTVIQIGALKEGRYDFVEQDIRGVVDAAKGKALVKVIIETCLLTDKEKVRACELSRAAGADIVKTSTGFSTGGATVADVALMKKTVGEAMGVKASGGVRDREAAIAMINAGACRIGTSAGIKIVTA